MNIHGLKNQCKWRRRLIRDLRSSRENRRENEGKIKRIEDKIAKLKDEIKKKRSQQKKGKRVNRRKGGGKK